MAVKLALVLLAAATAAGCASGPYPVVTSQSYTARCLGQPGRGENYPESRPMFFLFCAESP
jgi:hypothetical protein